MIRTLKDGRYNLIDLRRAVADNPTVSVRQQSGQWIVSRWSESRCIWIEDQPRYWEDERQALQRALGLN